MKKVLLLLLCCLAALAGSAYNDHRGFNLDSLERVVARWTPDAVDKASEEELIQLNLAYRDLMRGYSTLNGPQCAHYARKALSISRSRNWSEATADAARYLGQCFWAQEQYDSALVYFQEALAATDRMAGGATSPTHPEGYKAIDIDDARSALYGAIGNLYNTMEDIPRAMEYYARAGAIFDQYGWNESNSVLYYNIGETWLETGDLDASLAAYKKALRFGEVAGDSLLVAGARQGLGHLYLEKGRTGKALRYLREADEYYSAHEQELPGARKDNFKYTSLALRKQRQQLIGLLIGLIVLFLLSAGLVFLGRKLRTSRKERAEAAAVLEETLKDLQQAPSGVPVTSPREQEILTLLAKGFTTPQIAEAVHLSPETIKWYRKKLLVKFDVANTAELVLAAGKAGLI